ncbi:MAG: sigma-54-dependent Fis family transcriptional regulator [Polyangiaceae bacterium]|nr:sigma-54-dependent Fis family transcriptional regulator [Polyangiaceae bacterium]MCW5789915.1 sigma-54-dependent Fis family transcriptional regulator [Polyangiaceae bacterium]
MTSQLSERLGPQRLGPREVRRLCVEVQRGPSAGRAASPRLSSVVCVGHSRGVDLQLKEPGVAPFHVELRAEEGGVLVGDLGSERGTWLAVQGSSVRLDRGLVPYGTTLRVGDDELVATPLEDASLPAEELPTLPPELVVRSQALREAISVLSRLAVGRAPVLLSGERGVGKRCLTRALFAPAPFLEVACAGSARAVMSRLFGHAVGAFRAATEAAPGALDEGGVVYLSGVEKLPPEAQSALARALREQRYAPLGGGEPRPLTARLVAATDTDLRPLVNQGSFSDDLYCRLAGAHVRLPPLRERLAELPELVRVFEARAGMSPGTLGSGWITRVSRARFDENLRELERLVRDGLGQFD